MAPLLSCTPTSWTIGHVVPIHANKLQDSQGMGLGINSMVGREAKHIALAKFTHNFQFNKRWIQVFKHKYISLVWLCAMKLFTRRLWVFIFLRDVTLPSFAIAGYPGC